MEIAIALSQDSMLDRAKNWAKNWLAMEGLTTLSLSGVSGGYSSTTLAIDTVDPATGDESRFFLKIPKGQEPETVHAMQVDFTAVQEWNSLLATSRIGSSRFRVVAPEPVSINDEIGCYLMRGCPGLPANQVLKSKNHFLVRESDSVVEALSAALSEYYSTYLRAHGDLGLHNLLVGERQICLLDPIPSTAPDPQVALISQSDKFLAFDLANWLFVVLYKRVNMTFRTPVIRRRELTYSSVLIRGLMNNAQTNNFDAVRSAMMAHLSVRRSRAFAERRLHVVNEAAGLPASWQARRILRGVSH